MKKLIILVVTALFGAVLLNSCKSADCPAYTQTTPVEVEQAA